MTSIPDIFGAPKSSDSSKGPTVSLINQTRTSLNELLKDYSKAYTSYMLILNNPPTDINTAGNNANNDKIKEAYAQFNVTIGDRTEGAGVSDSGVSDSGPVGTTSSAAETAAETDDSSNEDVPRWASAAYKNAVKGGESALMKLYTEINRLATTLDSLVKKATPYSDANRGIMSAGAPALMAQINEMNASFEELQKKLNNKTDAYKFEELTSSFEVSQTITSSNFIKYMLYLFSAIFVLACLCLLYFFPSVAYLDMFILSLAIIIIVYYAYDYFQTRKL
jgi:hypothetical protein